MKTYNIPEQKYNDACLFAHRNDTQSTNTDQYQTYTHQSFFGVWVCVCVGGGGGRQREGVVVLLNLPVAQLHLRIAVLHWCSKIRLALNN